MSLNYHVIGQRIRNYRRQRNLSQNNVAEGINKSTTYISYLESGIKHPSLETLVDLANLFGITADITAWFNRHPGEYRYVILDDEDDMYGHMEHLVKTDFYSGLTEERADECIRMLGRR